MIYLRQSTASQEVHLGPFVDSTDAVTLESALTIANTDIKVYKAGATAAANKNSGGATYDANGIYVAVFDATDTNTPGSGRIVVNMAGALPVFMDFTVLPAQVYDSLIDGTDLLDANMSQISGAAVSTTTAQIGANVIQLSGGATAADNAEAFFDGTGYAGTNNVIPTVTTVTTVAGLAANSVTAAALATDAAQEIADTVLTRAMTEAYNADGAAPTLAQALFLIMQVLTESSVSGTTMTVKKLDGSTSAATFTLDSASSPTSITRAT